MEKSKKLQIVTSLAILNTFASPMWGNVSTDSPNKIQIIALEKHAIKNAQDASTYTVKIRSKHLAKLSKLTNKNGYSTTHTATTSTHY